MSALKPISLPVAYPVGLVGLTPALRKGGHSPYAICGAYTAIIGNSQDAPATASWFEFACQLSMQRMRRYKNYGVGGKTTAQYLSEQIPLVTALSRRPDVCVIGDPTNDHAAGVPAATTQGNIAAIVAALRASGIRPLPRLCMPSNAGGAGAFTSVAARRQAILDYNDWLISYCQSERLSWIDTFTPLYDSGTGGMNTTYTSDGVHPVTAGAWIIAKAVALNLPSFLASAAIPALATSTIGSNLMPNPLFADANSNGQADGYSVYGSGLVSASISAAALDPIGNAQLINGNGGTSIMQTGDLLTSTGRYEIAVLMRMSAVGQRFSCVLAGGTNIIGTHLYYPEAATVMVFGVVDLSSVPVNKTVYFQTGADGSGEAAATCRLQRPMLLKTA